MHNLFRNLGAIKMKFASIIFVLLAGISCESDQAKANRLRTQLTTDSLTVARFEREFHNAVARAGGAVSIHDPNQKRWYDSLSAAKDRLALTQRDYNKFMHQ